MHSPQYFASQQIYAKTEKGHKELVRPRFGLDSRQRRVLIQVDGTRNCRMLAQLCPEAELEDILAVLIKQEFIVYLKESDRTLASLQTASTSMETHFSDGNAIAVTSLGKCFAPTQSLARFSAAKELMLEVAVVHLGMLGREIMQKIEQAESADSLMMLAGRWSIALCESKTASRYATLYLEKLKLLLFEE